MTFTFGPLQLKLLELLRSGQYLQTRRKLCERVDGDTRCWHCIMGLIAHEVLGYEPEFDSFNVASFKDEQGVVSQVRLTETMLTRIGMTREGEDMLIDLNDILYVSFVELAKHIEAVPELYFDRSA